MDDKETTGISMCRSIRCGSGPETFARLGGSVRTGRSSSRRDNHAVQKDNLLESFYVARFDRFEHKALPCDPRPTPLSVSPVPLVPGQ